MDAKKHSGALVRRTFPGPNKASRGAWSCQALTENPSTGATIIIGGDFSEEFWRDRKKE